MNHQKAHWTLFNLFTKLFGCLSILVGLVFSFEAFLYWQHPEWVCGFQSISGDFKIDAAGVGIFAILLGIPFLLVKPYRPDLDPNGLPRNQEPSYEETAKAARFYSGFVAKTLLILGSGIVVLYFVLKNLFK